MSEDNATCGQHGEFYSGHAKCPVCAVDDGLPVDGGRGENSTRESCTCDGLGGVTLCDACASPAAAPGVTALAQWANTPHIHLGFSERQLQVQALLAEVERQDANAASFEDMAAIAERNAKYADEQFARAERLAAEVERLRQERDEAQHSLNVLRKTVPHLWRERDEALAELRKREVRGLFSTVRFWIGR